MEQEGKAEQEAGKKSGNKNEEMAGKRKRTKGHAIEKAGEVRGDEAKQMEKSGNDSEKAGVKAKKAAEDAAKKSLAPASPCQPRGAALVNLMRLNQSGGSPCCSLSPSSS